ncbi:transcriptional regulator, partial [Pseudoalteromonas sp. BSi20429]
MAKKRKNDTRLDPFATAVGSSSLDALLEQANAGDVIRMPAPSDPARQITLVCKVIAHADIESTTGVYGKNRRVQALLNEKSVSDILPAIREDGRNQHPALLWDQGDKSLVLAGSRRRMACILGNADYLVLSSSDFTDQDAKILAVSSDQYIAPSLWELGQAYQQTKNELIEQGKKGSYREIAAIEGVSHTAIADAIKAYEQIPADVIALYPTA